MSSLTTVDGIMFAGVGCETVTSSEISSSSTTSEPKRAFADTPPLARLRNESKSYEGDSSEISLEGNADGEPQRLDDPSRSQGWKAAVEDQSADGQGDLGVDLEVMPMAEGLAAQGEPVVVMPAQGQVSDAQNAGAERVSVEAIVAGSEPTQDLPAAISEGMQAEVNSQSFANKETVAIETGLARGEMSGSTGAHPLEAPETTTLAQSDEALGKPLRESNAPVVAPPESDQNTGGTDSPGTMARSQVAELGGSDTGAVAQDKPVAATPVITEAAEAVQTPVGQQTNGDNANRSDLDRGQPQEAISGMVGQDSTDPVPQDEQVGSQESAVARLEGQVQVVAAKGQTQSGFFAKAEEGSSTPSELPIDSQGGSSPVSESTSVQATAASDAQVASLKSPVQNVGEQILDSVHASMARGDKQVLIRLDPPELGSVTVRFQEQDGQISGILEVSQDQTRQEVEQALPQVLRGLQEAGVLVRRLDVVLAEQSEGDLDRESLPQDAWAQQQGSEQQDARPGHSPAGPWSTWAAAQQDTLELSEASQAQIDAARGRIDMLI